MTSTPALPAPAALPERTPYDAAHASIVDDGHTVTCVYIPDPEQARNPRKVVENLADRRYESVEVIATARRFLKKNGATFSGWIVEGPANDCSEPISGKREAMTVLRHRIRVYFPAPSGEAHGQSASAAPRLF